MLLALEDGRALPASVPAAEAGVAPSTASRHLSLLLDARLVTVEQQGWHRYYRLSGREAGELIEALARIAPPLEIRSLRDGTRAKAVRDARSCYDHLAGRLGVDLMRALIERGILAGGHDVGHRLTSSDRDELTAFGVDLGAVGRRPLIRAASTGASSATISPARSGRRSSPVCSSSGGSSGRRTPAPCASPTPAGPGSRSGSGSPRPVKPCKCLRLSYEQQVLVESCFASSP